MARAEGGPGPLRESYGSKPEMNASGKSDGPIVPENSPNKGTGAPGPAEEREGRGPAKGNRVQTTSHRAQNRARLHAALDRIRQVARRDKEVQFTTLWHHVYDVDRLRESYYQLKRSSVPGIDEETWQTYGKDLEARLQELSSRLQRGAYRAKPVLRTYIPKADGGQRPIGIPVLEDKIVQRATAEVLNAVYEEDFLGFSYGFRPKRSAHDALDALAVGIQHRKVSWVLDADLSGFFDAIDHEWLRKFLEHRIADPRVHRHVQKWLNAGVLEDSSWRPVEEGTPQGGSISPLLANVYLHYVFDLWVQRWRKRNARGDVIVVRYADDFIVGFEHREDAERFLRDLTQRLGRFRLELHPDKTRLIEFGRFAAERRQRRGQGKPETFDFLGFTHWCDRSRSGKFLVRRQTSRKRLRAKLVKLRLQLRRRLHWRVPEVGRWLGSVVRGYFQYHAVPLNFRSLKNFHYRVVRLWYRTLRRRSQRSTVTRKRVDRLAARYLPRPRILHPYPWERLRVTT